MTQDELEIELFRLRMRTRLLEHLVAKALLHGASAIPSLTLKQLSERRAGLENWLDKNLEVTDQAYGARFQNDPAQAALYADEVLDIATDLKATINSVAADIEAVVSKKK